MFQEKKLFLVGRKTVNKMVYLYIQMQMKKISYVNEKDLICFRKKLIHVFRWT